jgi:hypothetical protein
MSNQVKPKEATAIINALSGGVVPGLGIQHVTVGRSKEIEAILRSIKEVEGGNSVFRFWIGAFGSGKSFMLYLMKTIALRRNFVVTMTDFTPETRLYANDRKAVATYSRLIEGISIQTKPEGNALATIIEKWIEKIMFKLAQGKGISLAEVRNKKYKVLIESKIFRTVNKVSGVGGYEFGLVITKYFQGYIEDNLSLMKQALRWLRGEYTAKTDAREDLGVREIINDQNYYDMLKNFTNFFSHLGYAGFMINLDEGINLYKIIQSQTRNKNYEKILQIYNECLQGKVSNLFINLCGTKEFLENEGRGLFSYEALKTRLEGNRFETTTIRDYSQPVIYLKPLNQEEIFVLLNKLKSIYDLNYKVSIEITEEDIRRFMENVLNKQGADELLTPREVIKEFLHILSILRQNPSADKKELFSQIEIEPADSNAVLNDIEII